MVQFHSFLEAKELEIELSINRVFYDTFFLLKRLQNATMCLFNKKNYWFQI